METQNIIEQQGLAGCGQATWAHLLGFNVQSQPLQRFSEASMGFAKITFKWIMMDWLVCRFFLATLRASEGATLCSL